MKSSIIKKFFGGEPVREAPVNSKSSSAYWTEHMVVDKLFASAEESLAYFHWRNAQYPGYIDLMPVAGQDGKVVLDYGCGPGNDVVGFSVYSNPSKMIAVDVSATAIANAKKRIALHDKEVTFIHIDETDNSIPVESNSVDYIHSSGVLHHCANLSAVLKEFQRILKPTGEISVMVYNYQSIWLHLYVAWMKQLEQNLYVNLPVKDAFRATTDGESCPISHCYTPKEFLAIMEGHGFTGHFKGAPISLHELMCLPKRFNAMMDIRLAAEHRNFLAALTFDERGFPLYDGAVAGIDACFSFRKM